MDYVTFPDNPDVALHSSGLSLDVDMEAHILVVTEALVVTVDLVVLVVTWAKVAMVATVLVPSRSLDSVYGFT